MTHKCQCEHQEHEHDKGDTLHSIVETNIRVKTIYGHYWVCATCHNAGHMGPYQEEQVIRQGESTDMRFDANAELNGWKINASADGERLYIQCDGKPGQIHVHAADEGFVIDVWDDDSPITNCVATTYALYGELEKE